MLSEKLASNIKYGAQTDSIVLSRLYIGRLNLAFARGEYTIILEAGARYSLKVEHNGETEVWPISVQEVRGSDIRLSGLADWVPEILENACWFVLEIGSKPQITYWEDKVINRVDFLKP